MGIMKRVSVRLYRALAPEALRSSKMVAELKKKLLGHDWVYDSDYYEKYIEGPAVRAAGRIVESIMTEFSPKRAIDVGCGTGALLAMLRDRGCEVYGLEYADAALKACRARGLDVAKFDLKTNSLSGNRTYDVAVSMEVAEHLPEASADRYVDLLARLSPAVVFTAAPPGQGGTDHVNEQPASYWTGKFGQRGFEYAEVMTRQWRDTWRCSGDVQDHYHRNLLIFRRR